MRIGSITSTLVVSFPFLLQVASWCNNPGNLKTKGWTEYNGALYMFFKDITSNYTDSEKHCEKDGGSIATAKTSDENTFVSGLIDGFFPYLGLIRNPQNSSIWVWNDQETVTWTKWDPRHPTGVNCAGIQNSYWTSVTCSPKKRIVCKCRIGAVGAACNTTNGCSNPYARCTNGTCQCITGYTTSGTLCKAAVGAACNTTNGCSNPYASCTSGTCQCNTGYTTSGTLCKAAVGAACDTTNGCSNPYASCTSGTCQCNTGYTTSGTLCKAEAVITPSDSVFLNGTNDSLTCTCKGISMIEWYYNGIRITSINNSRIQIGKLAILNESMTSNLTFEPVKESDSGLYECVCQTNNIEYVVRIRMTCLAPAVVYVVPVMMTVEKGSNVTINCKLANNAGPVSFQWYKDDKPLDIGSGYFDYTASSLNITNVTQSANYSCRGNNSAGYGNIATAMIHVLSTNGGYCNESTDDWNITWEHTNVDVRLTKSCPSNYTGEATRFCTINREWEKSDYSQCVSDKLNNLKYQIEKLEDGILVTNASTVLTDLEELTKPTVTILKEAELKTVVNLLNKINVIIESPSAHASNDMSENFLETASNILDSVTTDSWQSLISKREPGAETVLMVVESFVMGLSESAQNNVSKINGSFQTNNLDVGIGYNSSIVFPIKGNDISLDNRISSTSLSLQTDDVHRYAAVLFRNVSRILPSRTILNGKPFDRLDVGPDVMSLQLDPWPTNQTIKLWLMFQAFNTVYTYPICSYWELNATGKEDGAWSSEGCSVVLQSSSGVLCECNHLTNFAILMTTYEATDPGHNVRLSIISSVGCTVSILCLLLTILGHLKFWRYVKTRNTYIVLNICAALIFSYGIFLAGVNRTENKVVCTAVAALLHYIYLAVFFLMLVGGIEIAVSVLFVFFTRSRLKLLLPLAWLIPAGIVGVSMGISQLSGYGNKKYCWLSVREGLIWAFVGPAALVILFNAVIIFIVMKKIFSTSSLISKTKKDKAKIGLRSLGVLLAVTGVTWVLGIFSVNEDLVVFQYLFALFNSLQGLIMFVFHCLLNKQIRAAIAARNQRKVRVVKSTTDQKAASADDSKIRVTEVCMKHSAANPSSANVITTCDESDEPNARMEDFCTEQTNMTTRHSKWQTVWLQLQEFVKSNKDNTVYSNQENITEIDCGSEAQENLEN